MTPKTTRRAFLATSIAVAGGIVGTAALKANQTPAESSQSPLTATMPERELGSTGVRLPILGLGGAGQTPLSWENSE